MQRRRIRTLATVAAVTLSPLLLAFPGLAQNVERVGPLTISVRGPREVVQTGVSMPVRVTVWNSAAGPVSGSMQVKVIDRWQAQPAAPVAFTVQAGGTANLGFSVIAADTTVNAEYPIHAYTVFQFEGRRMVSSPVIVVPIRLAPAPRARLPIEWRPIPVKANRAIGLWQTPMHRVRTTAVAQETPVGRPPAVSLWQRGAYRRGGMPPPSIFQTSDSVQVGGIVQRGDSREAIAITLGPRPPSFAERVERAAIEFPLDLPKGLPIRLQFLTALGAEMEGALCRVRAAPYDSPAGDPGAVIAEFRTTSTVWQNGAADLSRFAGQRIRLQLETSAESRAAVVVYWAEPTLIAGQPTAASPFPPPAGSPSKSLGKAGAWDVRLWPGKRGLLDAVVGFSDGRSQLMFHGFQLRVLGDDLSGWRAANELLEVREESSTSGYRVRHRFESWAGGFDLVGEAAVRGGALQARFWLENAPAPRPWLPVYIEDVAAGAWSQRAARIYAGHGNVVLNPEAFEMDSNGHNLAASFVGFDFANGFSLVQAVDIPPDLLRVQPERLHYSLHTSHTHTLSFIPAASVWEGAKVWRQINGLKPSAGVTGLAGRFVIDLWGTRSPDLAADLRKSFQYGLTHALVIDHGWQRPPAASDRRIADAAEVCRKFGVLWSPHDNYIDFYPDAEGPGNPLLRLRPEEPKAEGFSYENIVFTRDGEPRKAWWHSTVQAESYRARPDRVMDFVKAKWELMKKAGATSNFIDVYSSESVYDFYTWDGQFVDRIKTRQYIGEIFNWIRDYIGNNSPQTSEAGHDHLIGWVDGATAVHLRVDPNPKTGMVIRLKAEDSERIPWFDAAHHDRFVQHGAGYPDRYASGLDQRMHGTYSDDYITTEVLTGHAATANHPFGRDVVRKYWLLQGVLKALSLRNMERFEFAGNIHRQAVEWERGGQVWVNRGEADWQAAGHVLPQYGFYAKVQSQDGSYEAAIERKDGLIVEWSQSTSRLYVNARPPVFDIPLSGTTATAGPDPRLARMNPQSRPVSFGAVTTNGGLQLHREGEAAILTPLPASPAFEVELAWTKLPWKSPEPARAEALDIEGKVLRTVPLARNGADLRLTCEAGVFAYRLR
mgnify:CR=1 FL=1